jgi:acyl carrier protein
MSLDPRQVCAQGAPAVRALLGVPAALPPPDPGAQAAPASDPLAPLRAVKEASPSERVALLRSYVHGQVARVLGFNASALDPDMPLSSLGFDSLMAVQLRNKVQTDLAVEVPIAEYLTGPTVAELAAVIAARLGGPAGGPAAPAPQVRPQGGSWEEGTL